MTPSPPTRDPVVRTVLRAFAAGVGVALVVAGIGQAIAFVVYLARGSTGSFGPYARLGAAYVEAVHHVDVGVRVLPAGGATPASVDVGVALLTVLAFAVVALAWVGRRVAAGSSGAGVVTAVVAAAVGYAVVPLALAFVVRGVLELPSNVPAVREVDVTVSLVQSFAVPLAVAGAALVVGALLAAGADGSGVAGDVVIADVVAGGVRAFVLGLGLSILGVLVFAGAQPAFARAYGDVVSLPHNAHGDLAVGGHLALTVPNQAVWVLVPALGARDAATLDAHPLGSRPSTRRSATFLSYERAPGSLPVSDGGLGSPHLGPAPRPLLAFLLVPLLATIAGGMRAARSTASRMRRALAGAASGIVFAALVAAGSALSRVDVVISGPFLGRDLVLALGPDVALGTALAAGWGVLGGGLGGALARQDGGGTGASSE